MKKFYLLTVAVLAGVSLTAQTAIEPPVVAVDGITLIDSDVAAYSEVLNQSEETKDYVWEREIIELTDGWETAVCDLNLCHLSFVDDATFTLAGNSAGTMDVHVYPNGNSGAAIVSVRVTNVDDDEDFAEGMYYFNQALSAPERLSNALKIYPNPVVDEFFVEGGENVERLEIFDISGKLIKEFAQSRVNSFSVSELEGGNYIVRMWDNNNRQLSTNLLTIQ